jgi:uncharacterized phiE125 gp8 family phage protein
MEQEAMTMLSLITGPTEQVLTIEEVKGYLRVDDGEEDAIVGNLIAAATQRLDGRDGILGRCLMHQTWQLALARFPASAITLPLPPTIGVLSVKYLDTNGQLQTLSEVAYRIIPGGWEGAQVIPAVGLSWPSVAPRSPDAVRVTFQAGYESVGSPPQVAVPEPIRQAMLLMISDWYDQRSNVVMGTSVEPLPFATETLLAPYRVNALV